MAPQTLRPYQDDGMRRVLAAFKEGARRILTIAPTGAGKTTLFSWLASRANGPVLILVHRRELARQAANRLREFGVDFGTIMAGEKARPHARVQIASKDTLVRRLERGHVPAAGLIVVDEAHLSTAETWAKILNHYPSARVLGVTATPWRLSGKPLASAYDRLIVVARPRELRELGFLSPYTGFSYKAPDLSNVEKVGDEFNQQQAGAAMSQSAIVADIVGQWQKHAAHLSTLAFCVTVEQSQGLCAEFKAAGVRAEHLDGNTPTVQRDAILARLDAGVTQVVCNVGIAIEGLDVPRVKCIVDAAPTMSLARAIQKWGRGRRPWQNVTCRIHDHAFNITRHGLPDDDRDYSLNAKPEKPPALRTCESCFAVYVGESCPSCQHVNEVKPRGEREGLKVIDDAEQVHFSDSDTSGPPPADPERPIVNVGDFRWKTPRVIEGELQRRFQQDTQYGKRWFYIVETKRYRYELPGASVLDRLMAKVPDGARVRIDYRGEVEISGGRTMKDFGLEVDDGRAAA